MIRKTIREDAAAIIKIIRESGQFDEAGVAHVQGVLERHLAGEDDDLWFTAYDDVPVGVAYCAPEPVTEGTWNLLLLWTRPDRKGAGYGSALVNQIEKELKERNVRLLIVETSGLSEFDDARRFYMKCGFAEEGRIKDFFSSGDAKVIFTKPLSASPSV